MHNIWCLKLTSYPSLETRKAKIIALFAIKLLYFIKYSEYIIYFLKNSLS
jgi:hypothetical protein